MDTDRRIVVDCRLCPTVADDPRPPPKRDWLPDDPPRYEPLDEVDEPRTDALEDPELREPELLEP